MGEENKQAICNALWHCLIQTRNQHDLQALKYDPKNEWVTACYTNGISIIINVAIDSGVAMIRDIMRYMD